MRKKFYFTLVMMWTNTATNAVNKTKDDYYFTCTKDNTSYPSKFEGENRFLDEDLAKELYTHFSNPEDNRPKQLPYGLIGKILEYKVKPKFKPFVKSVFGNMDFDIETCEDEAKLQLLLNKLEGKR